MERLWSARDARGLAPGHEFEAGQRLEGELGYGLGCSATGSRARRTSGSGSPTTRATTASAGG